MRPRPDKVSRNACALSWPCIPAGDPSARVFGSWSVSITVLRPGGGGGGGGGCRAWECNVTHVSHECINLQSWSSLLCIEGSLGSAVAGFSVEREGLRCYQMFFGSWLFSRAVNWRKRPLALGFSGVGLAHYGIADCFMTQLAPASQFR